MKPSTLVWTLIEEHPYISVNAPSRTPDLIHLLVLLSNGKERAKTNKFVKTKIKKMQKEIRKTLREFARKLEATFGRTFTAAFIQIILEASFGVFFFSFSNLNKGFGDYEKMEMKNSFFYLLFRDTFPETNKNDKNILKKNHHYVSVLNSF